MTLRDASDVTQELYETAGASFEALLPLVKPVRLLGVHPEHLTSSDATPRPLELGADHPRWQEVDGPATPCRSASAPTPFALRPC